VSLLALGVLIIAQAGQLETAAGRGLALALAIGCIAFTFRLDARAAQRLFPSHALSLHRPVGIAYWVMIIVGSAQAGATILLPLTLQVVHEVTPLLVGASSLVTSTAWTAGTFIVAGWSGSRERFAMISGPVLMIVGTLCFIGSVHAAQGGGVPLGLLLTGCFFVGFGVGVHHVHLGARTMENAEKGEETVTASSISMVRSLGQAIGTAAAGMVANIAGLGAAIDGPTVTHAVGTVFACALVPLAFAVVLIVRFANRVVPREGAARGGLADEPAGPG
jgi:hypothetical protein